MPKHRAERDHVRAYNFFVEIDGIDAGYFKGVDGLNAELRSGTYQDGDDIILLKQPDRVGTVEELLIEP